MIKEISNSGPARTATAEEAGNSNASTQGAITDRIITLIVESSRPAGLPLKWDFLRRINDIRQLNCSGQELLSRLNSEVTDEDLRRAGIIAGSRQNSRLHPLFSVVPCKFLILRNQGGVPVNLVSASGELATKAPPLMQYMIKDGANSAKSDGSVVVVASDDDLQAMHGLGYVVTTAAGLARLTAAQVYELFGQPPHSPNRRTHRIIIAAWQIAALELSAGEAMVQVLEHLLRMRDVFKIDPQDMFSIWQPTSNEFWRINSALAFRDRTVVSSAIHSSLCNALRHTADWEEIAQAVISQSAGAGICTSWKQLQLELREAESRPGDARQRRRVRHALERYKNVYVRMLTNKFLDAAECCAAPCTSALLLIGADMAEQMVQRQEMVRNANEYVATLQLRPNSEMFAPDNLTERLRFADFFAKLMRAMPSS